MIDRNAATRRTAEPEQSPASRSPMHRALARFLRNRQALVGLVLVLLVLALAVGAPLIRTHPVTAMNVSERLAAPSPAHLMGTDQFGRDVFSRVVEGSRVSMLSATVAVAIALGLGLLLGSLAGYHGGWIDELIMRTLEVFFAFPALLLALAIVAVLGPGLPNAMLAIGLVYTPYFARVVRASVLSTRGLDFVTAARALGAPDSEILYRHVLGNSLGPVIVQAAVGFSSAILVEASLSFLGLGVQPPTPSWGMMLNDARVYLENAPWCTLGPAAAIFVATLGFNLLADGLRSFLDPTGA